jgi:hypothetical protein
MQGRIIVKMMHERLQKDKYVFACTVISGTLISTASTPQYTDRRSTCVVENGTRDTCMIFLTVDMVTFVGCIIKKKQTNAENERQAAQMEYYIRWIIFLRLSMVYSYFTDTS